MSRNLSEQQRKGSPIAAELTFRAMFLGLALSAVLAAANAYLGLFAGMTVSASIPAAVLSMGLLRAAGGSILENNLVQTAASAGESAAAGAIFTLPALLILGAWVRFPWLDCMLLVGSGGVLGVLFTIFLRRPLIIEGELPFPEGVATAEVLKIGHGYGDVAGISAHESTVRGRSLLSSLGLGAGLGAGFKFLESGMGVCRASIEGAVKVLGGSLYLGVSASPALMAVGYIVGIRIAILVCAGGLLNWVGVIPFVSAGVAGDDAVSVAWHTWSQKTRYLGVGAMTFSGLFTLFELRSTIARAFIDGISNLSASKLHRSEQERDLPFSFILVSVALCSAVLFWMFFNYIPSIGGVVLVTAAVLVISFLFSAVAAYMAGLLGSSNNPVSGVTIATIIIVSLLLTVLGVDEQVGATTTIFVGSVVCTAAAIGGDNMQDLKAGQLLGASPAKQQLMQLLGVVVAALVLGPVLQLLADSYGFGSKTLEHPHPLLAPQAVLMASVARGMFGGELPWNFIFAGGGIGALLALMDSFLKRMGSPHRTPPLALALGLYLPLQLSLPVLLGGLARHISCRNSAEKGQESATAGILLSAGLITGEALMGVALAAVVFFFGGFGILNLDWQSGLASLTVIGFVLFRLSKKPTEQSFGSESN